MMETFCSWNIHRIVEVRADPWGTDALEVKTTRDAFGPHVAQAVVAVIRRPDWREIHAVCLDCHSVEQ